MDLKPDPRLQAALHHAPDRDLAAPAGLSERILAQARAVAPAAARSRPAPSPGWVERWFGWMSRPLAAGAFGSVLVAGVVGLMWREGPPPDHLHGADRAAPAVPAAAAPTPSAPPATPAAATGPAAPAAPLPDTVAPAGHAPRPELPTRPTVATPPADSAGRATVMPTTPGTAPAPVATAAQALSSPRQLQSERRPEPRPAAPADAGPQPAAPAPAPAAAPAAAGTAKLASARAASSETAAALSATTAAAAAPPPARDAGRDRAAARPVGAAAFDPLLPALLQLSGDADLDLRQRLLRLQARVIGPWTEERAPPAPGWGEEVRSADGRRLGRMQLEPASLLWQGSDGLLWRGPLSADDGRR